MITIRINKKEDSLPEGMTVASLLEKRGAKRMSVWVNGKQLLMAEYAVHVLQDGDDVKLLRVVAGG
ncbi:MAG: MoaD/ThiS family protein [Anaerovorax sp.]